MILHYFNNDFGHYTKVKVQSREEAMDIVLNYGDRNMGFSVTEEG